MKSIVLLTIINLITFITNKTNLSNSDSGCTITLVDDDTWGKDNQIYKGTVSIPKLVWDLRKDVKEITLKNTNSLNCRYSLMACREANFRRCKKYTGTVGPKGKKSLVSLHYIKKMVSITGSSLVVNPPPKTLATPIIVKAAITSSRNEIKKFHDLLRDKLSKAVKAKSNNPTKDCLVAMATDKKFVCDENIINGSYNIYRHVRTHLKIKEDPVVHWAELKNKVGVPSTIVMHEILLRNFMVVNQSAFYRICVVPLSQKKFKVFIDIKCPFSRCPADKKELGKECNPKDYIIDNLKFKNVPHAVLLAAFNRRKRLMLLKKLKLKRKMMKKKY